MTYTEGKHPIEIGSITWGIIQMFLTFLTVICFVVAYKYHWVWLIAGLFFGFFAFNFWFLWYRELRLLMKERQGSE